MSVDIRGDKAGGGVEAPVRLINDVAFTVTSLGDPTLLPSGTWRRAVITALVKA